MGAWGGIELFKRRGINVDVVAGSVTDSQMGEDYIEREFGVPAGNARRDGARLFELIRGEGSRSGVADLVNARTACGRVEIANGVRLVETSARALSFRPTETLNLRHED